ncbi:hypothetical protein RvY_16438 [Ramazzottius varieornatus]|uniref:Reverse transcriptase domain-containing protein n=1 Tax=Ramazzottius varieornatus TaxID=947166 RepID=A0A1D1VYG0_RAMVA|nr:hypothetical protein RvY_16438 [Ramazzottius varieornatus]
MSNVRGNTDGEMGKQLIFRYANLNGIKSKSEELKAWTERGKVDIGAFVETWADDSVTDTLIADLEKYKVHRKDRAGCRKEGGGGVAIIVQKDLHTLRATEYEVEGLELMWVKVVGMKMVALVGVLYAPGYDMEVFAKLRCSLEKIPPYLRRNMILVNDFNCPDIDWEDLSAKKPRTRELLSVIKEFALFQRSKRSTEVQLLHMVHRWSQGLSEKKEVEAVFLDCTKAFDRVPHEVLVRSLQDHGITGDLLDLMADYLRGRTQRVTVGGYYSEYSEVRSGVPQGSVLGPLLFIVAVNKLSVSVRCELYQYADDLVAHQVISKPEDCRAFQESLDQLGENCEEAGLSLNPSKSQHVRISFKRSGSVPVPQGNYSISDQKIPTKSQTTCLGVVLDRKLNWTAQIDAVTAKCRKRLHAIRSYFPLQLGAARQLLYISLVRPVAEYACSVWNPTNHKHQRQLEQVQKDFLKSIRLSKIPKGQHDGDFSQYRQHLAEVKWDYLWTRRVKAVLVNGFKIWTNGFPDGRLLLNVSRPVQQPPTRANTRS